LFSVMMGASSMVFKLVLAMMWFLRFVVPRNHFLGIYIISQVMMVKQAKSSGLMLGSCG